MFRKSLWRYTVSDVVHLHQDQALNTTIFILKEFGPTGFLLKEEGESKKFKVCLGNPHTCTCLTYIKEKDLCKHICWVLIRKFRLPRDHEYCFQLGLVDRQINEMVQDLHKARTPHQVKTPSPQLTEEGGGVKQKDIETGDVCPICQEDLMAKRLPVSYCRYGCGNNVHISCMKVWADHQARSDLDSMVKCPLCREAFEPMKVLLDQVKNAANLITTAERERSDKHLGIICNNCKVCPITGKCFKCSICNYYYLCEACFNGHCHPQHPFAFRAKRFHQWTSLRQSRSRKSGESQEQAPESTDDQYSSTVKHEKVPEHIVKSLLPVEVRQGSKLLKPGQQCRLCLKSFLLGQHVKHLPCHHKFHSDCVDSWLLQSNSCPLDGHVIYNPLTWQRSGKDITPKHGQSSSKPNLKDHLQQDLFIPGLALQCRANIGDLPYSVVDPRRSNSPMVSLSKESVNRKLGCHINNEHIGRSGCTSILAGPSINTNTSLRDASSLPQRECHSVEPLRRALEKTKSDTKASYFVKVPRVKQNVKSLSGAILQVGNEKQDQRLSVGLNGLEMQVHSREISRPGRARPQNRSCAPRPIAVAVKEKGPVVRITGLLVGSPDAEAED
ncbi:hypothetical protein AGOR_G00062260 [Albula goreensis]|uniref:E3 ubiquitin-protein ligase ZSWIM2 n=1 Tax=Albula goreensis TaxID=1534307 RepID=A0A8T3DQN5_9TELE|nr:hypothetical protein AGOR_G00062260 [Albula goreensis]